VHSLRKWASAAAAQRQRKLVDRLMDRLVGPFQEVGVAQWAMEGPAVHGFPLELALMHTGSSLLICGRAGLLLDRDFAAREIAYLLLELNDSVPYGSFRLVRLGDRHEAMLAHLADLSRHDSEESLVLICHSILESMRATIVRLFATDLLATEFTPPRRV
jgi:hypothetical protein